jgi:hypothetical protein
VTIDQGEEAPAPLLPDTWTVKEVVADLKSDIVKHLDRQDTLLREISNKVDSKADRADLIELGHQVQLHGIADAANFKEQSGRIQDLEGWRQSSVRLWAGAGVVLVAMAGLLGGLFGGHVIG